MMPVIEDCLHKLTEEHPRVYANIAVDYHGERSNRLRDSIARVQEYLEEPVRSAP